jgi:hypothetical protein
MSEVVLLSPAKRFDPALAGMLKKVAVRVDKP